MFIGAVALRTIYTKKTERIYKKNEPQNSSDHTELLDPCIVQVRRPAHTRVQGLSLHAVQVLAASVQPVRRLATSEA
jgi:hypothetical protein